MVALVVPESWRTGLANCFTHGYHYCIVIIGGLSTELGGREWNWGAVNGVVVGMYALAC